MLTPSQIADVAVARLGLLPGSPPPWASAVHALPIDDSNEDPPAATIAQMVGHIEHHTGRTLLHFQGCIHSTKTRQVEAEITTVLVARGAANPEEVFEIRNAMLGKVEIPRQKSESFNSDHWPRENTLPGKDGVEYLPALLPLIGSIVGYLSTDLLHLLPQIPVVHSTEGAITAIPEVGGVSILYKGNCVGRVDYWNWRWQPMHEMNSLPPSAVCTTLSADAIEELFRVRGYTVKRCWKILVSTRETDYGSWVDTIRFGILA